MLLKWEVLWLNNNVVQEQNQVRVETKIKKIYLIDNKNDIQQKQAQEDLKKKLVGAILDVYTNGNIINIESRRFMAYIERFVKTNKSKNDINYRIASLYNYIISKYSDFIEINQIIQNEEEQY